MRTLLEIIPTTKADNILMQENRGGKREGAGRKSRKEKGLEETIQISAKIEKSVADTCIDKHGSYSNALRYAAKSKKQKPH